MVYVVPDIVDVFVDTGQELPVLTRGLIALSDFSAQFWYFAVAVGIGGRNCFSGGAK